MKNIFIWVLPTLLNAIHICSIFNLLTLRRRIFSNWGWWITQRAKSAILVGSSKINLFIYTRICCFDRIVIIWIFMIHLLRLLQGSFRTFIPLYKSWIYFLGILSSFRKIPFESFWLYRSSSGEARLEVLLEGKFDLLHLYPHWLLVWYKGYSSQFRMHNHRWLRSL